MAFNVGTLMQIGQQPSVARKLEPVAIDVCLPEISLQDSSTVVILSLADLRTKHSLHFSGDTDAVAAGLAGGCIVLSNKAESLLLDWFLINNHLSAVRF